MANRKLKLNADQEEALIALLVPVARTSVLSSVAANDMYEAARGRIPCWTCTNNTCVVWLQGDFGYDLNALTKRQSSAITRRAASEVCRSIREGGSYHREYEQACILSRERCNSSVARPMDEQRKVKALVAVRDYVDQLSPQPTAPSGSYEGVCREIDGLSKKSV